MIYQRLTAVLAALIVAFGLTDTPARADNHLDALVTLDILDGGLTERGTQQAAIRLSLADGWKTYWRAPGDTGIPPRFDWSDSVNVKSVTLNWPTPDVFDLNGFRSIGYKHELVLPIEITATRPDQPVQLKGSIEIGICQDICVPARLTFDQPLDPKTGRNRIIASALAAQPRSAAQAGVRSATCRLSPAGDGGLRIRAEITMPSAGGEEVAVIEPGNPEIWASETTTSRQGNVLTVIGEVSHVSGTSFALDRSQIRLTVLGKRHAVDILGCTPG